MAITHRPVVRRHAVAVSRYLAFLINANAIATKTSSQVVSNTTEPSCDSVARRVSQSGLWRRPSVVSRYLGVGRKVAWHFTQVRVISL